MLNHTVPAAAEGLPVVNSVINISALASLPIDELTSLHSVASSLADVTAAFCCQPRFMVPGTIHHTSAGGVISDINSLLCRLQDSVRTEVRKRNPSSRDEAEARAWCLLQDAAHCEDSLHVFADLALDLVGADGNREGGK